MDPSTQGRSLDWRRAAALVAWTFFLVPAGTDAQEPIQVTVDRNQVALGDQLYLTIRIEGSPDEPPGLPELPDFRVLSRGERRDMQIVNGRVSNSTSYNYLLIPTRAGSFEIGPATALIDGAEVRSRPFAIQVSAGADQTDEQDRNLFVTATVSTDRPWQGQQVVYTWRFYSRVPVGQGSIESMDFGSDVVVEDLGDVRQFSDRQLANAVGDGVAAALAAYRYIEG